MKEDPKRKTENLVVGATNKWLNRASQDSLSVGFGVDYSPSVHSNANTKVNMMGSDHLFSVRPERDEMTLQDRIEEVLYEEEDSWVLMLTRLYQSVFCTWMYVFIAVLCVVLLIWSIFHGKTWAHHWLFILFECIINLFIVVDIAFKMKLLVSKKTSNSSRASVASSETATTPSTLS